MAPDVEVIESLKATFGVPDRSLRPLEIAHESFARDGGRYSASLVADWALRFDAGEKDFAPTRNLRLQEALDLMRFHPRGADYGEKVFQEVLLNKFVAAKQLLSSGKVQVEESLVAHFDRSGKAFIGLRGVEIALTQYTLDRALEWNNLGQNLIKSSDGIIALIEHPAIMIHALGLGQWLDVGNLMLQPGLVSDRLLYPGASNIDLYKEFGVTPETFVWFTHLKHHPGLYDYGKVDGPHLDIGTYLQAYERIAELMKLNFPAKAEGISDVRLSLIISPGSWYYDPQLASDPHLAYVQAIAGRVVPIGEAERLGFPKQVEFATLSSKQRLAMYHRVDDRGNRVYSPMLTARSVSLHQIEDLLKQKEELINHYH